MLLRIRNFAGFWILVVVAGGLVAVSWYTRAQPRPRWRPGDLDPAALGPETRLELIGSRRRGKAGHSDAGQLARLTWVSAELWAVLFLVVNCLGLMLEVALLLPAVVDLVLGLLPQTR